MTKPILTQKRLKELLHYDPDTGVFTWLVYRNVNARVGGRCGHVEDRTLYRWIYIDDAKHKSARLAFLYMKGRLPSAHMDHINHIRSDDRWCNLREVTQQENNKNKTMQTNNTSGVMGVHWKKAISKWGAKIVVNKKQIHIGYYSSINKATSARKAAEVKYGFHKNHGSLKP